MRIVLDTNVVVAAMRSKSGASAELVRLAATKQLTLVGGLALALEYIDVCERPES
jgi:predicted nucleic acid-binding protein